MDAPAPLVQLEQIIRGQHIRCVQALQYPQTTPFQRQQLLWDAQMYNSMIVILGSLMNDVHHHNPMATQSHVSCHAQTQQALEQMRHSYEQQLYDARETAANATSQVEQLRQAMQADRMNIARIREEHETATILVTMSLATQIEKLTAAMNLATPAPRGNESRATALASGEVTLARTVRARAGSIVTVHPVTDELGTAPMEAAEVLQVMPGTTDPSMKVAWLVSTQSLAKRGFSFLDFKTGNPVAPSTTLLLSDMLQHKNGKPTDMPAEAICLNITGELEPPPSYRMVGSYLLVESRPGEFDAAALHRINASVTNMGYEVLQFLAKKGTTYKFMQRTLASLGTASADDLPQLVAAPSSVGKCSMCRRTSSAMHRIPGSGSPPKMVCDRACSTIYRGLKDIHACEKLLREAGVPIPQDLGEQMQTLVAYIYEQSMCF